MLQAYFLFPRALDQGANDKELRPRCCSLLPQKKTCLHYEKLIISKLLKGGGKYMLCNIGPGGPQMFVGGFGLGWIFVIIFWALIIWAIIAIVRAISHTGDRDYYDRDRGYNREHRDADYGKRNYHRDSMWHTGGREDEALRTLRDRYARGEIDREEYEMRRRDLMNHM